jgi:hypothetical protein
MASCNSQQRLILGIVNECNGCVAVLQGGSTLSVRSKVGSTYLKHIVEQRLQRIDILTP